MDINGIIISNSEITSQVRLIGLNMYLAGICSELNKQYKDIGLNLTSKIIDELYTLYEDPYMGDYMTIEEFGDNIRSYIAFTKRFNPNKIWTDMICPILPYPVEQDSRIEDGMFDYALLIEKLQDNGIHLEQRHIEEYETFKELVSGIHVKMWTWDLT